MKRLISSQYSYLIFSRAIRVLLFIWFSQILHADLIHLKNGKRVEADKVWNEGNQICYEKDGNVFRFSQSIVERVEKTAVSASLSGREAESPTSRDSRTELDKIPSSFHLSSDKNLSPKTGIVQNGIINQKELGELAAASQNQSSDPSLKHHYLAALTEVIEFQVDHGDQNGAIDNLRRFLELEKNHLPAALILASLYLKQGQYPQSENLLAQFQIANDRSAELHYLLGATYYFEEKNELAGLELRHSLQLEFNPEVQTLLKKVEGENRAENNYLQANSLHFVIRYEGTETNQNLGRAILESLERSYNDLERVLNFSPRENIAVVLYPDEVFQDITQAPHWAGALNDGKIRLPLKGISRMDHRLEMILKHELTHSFIRMKTGGNCPVWMNEGLAQYFSGASARALLPAFKQAVALQRLPLLKQLEAPFVSLSSGDAILAYQQSLLTVEFIAQAHGLDCILRLLDECAKSGGFENALQSVMQKDYVQMQQDLVTFIQQS